MTDCPCNCHGHGAAFRPACNIPGGCGHLHKAEDEQRSTIGPLLIDLTFLREHWDHLAHARVPGTPRPWRQELLDPRRRDEMAARDRLERLNPDPDAPGFTSSSTQVPILDLMVDIWMTLDDLVLRIERWLPRTDYIDRGTPTSQLNRLFNFVAEWLPLLSDVEPKLLTIADRNFPRLARDVTTALSLIRSGQLLAGAVCGYCLGVTPKAPAGGAQTLRVEEIVKARAAKPGIPKIDPEFAIVCWNADCEPPEAECGNWYKGRPAWPEGEWDWLANKMITADPPARSLLDETQFTADDVIPVVHSGRSGVDQAICIIGTHSGVLAGRHNRDVQKPPPPNPSFDRACPVIAPGTHLMRVAQLHGIDGHAAAALIRLRGARAAMESN